MVKLVVYEDFDAKLELGKDRSGALGVVFRGTIKPEGREQVFVGQSFAGVGTKLQPASGRTMRVTAPEEVGWGGFAQVILAQSPPMPTSSTASTPGVLRPGAAGNVLGTNPLAGGYGGGDVAAGKFQPGAAQPWLIVPPFNAGAPRKVMGIR